MITEEFSFPIIPSNNVVHLTVLPPLWRISSVNLSDADHELEQENRRNKRKVIFRSFSQAEGEIIKKENNNIEKAAEAEEKMDMLWEDFNEEASSDNYYLENSTASDSETDHHTNKNNYDFGDECNIDVPESERPRTKKKSLEMVGKIMKKLFWLNNRATIKKRGTSI